METLVTISIWYRNHQNYKNLQARWMIAAKDLVKRHVFRKQKWHCVATSQEWTIDSQPEPCSIVWKNKKTEEDNVYQFRLQVYGDTTIATSSISLNISVKFEKVIVNAENGISIYSIYMHDLILDEPDEGQILHKFASSYTSFEYYT